MNDKKMNHAAYQKNCKSMSYAELLYTIKDANEAMQVNPTNPNNSYYADEVNYCSMELNRR